MIANTPAPVGFVVPQSVWNERECGQTEKKKKKGIAVMPLVSYCASRHQSTVSQRESRRQTCTNLLMHPNIHSSYIV